MARARNPNRDKAKKTWLQSGGKVTTKELAAAADVPEHRIRKWKSEDKWQEALDKKKRGGQPSNKNAAGHGAPKGNSNAETHGAYSRVHLDDLTPEERAYIESLTLDAEAAMLRELQLLMAKERDLTRKIKRYENADPAELFVDRVVEMRTPKSNERHKHNEEKLEELLIERDNFHWEMNSIQTPTTAQEKKLAKYEREIEELQDKISAHDKANDGSAFNISMQTIFKASPFDRAMKLEAEYNKIHGRIL